MLIMILMLMIMAMLMMIQWLLLWMVGTSSIPPVARGAPKTDG